MRQRNAPCLLSRIWGIEEQRTIYPFQEGLRHCPSHSWGEEGAAFILTHHLTSYAPNLLPHLRASRKPLIETGVFCFTCLLGYHTCPCFLGIHLAFPYQSLFMSSTSQCLKTSGLSIWTSTLFYLHLFTEKCHPVSQVTLYMLMTPKLVLQYRPFPSNPDLYLMSLFKLQSISFSIFNRSHKFPTSQSISQGLFLFVLFC